MPNRDTVESSLAAPPVMVLEPQALLDAAADFQTRGLLDEAAACYLKVIVAAADNVRAWLGLAQCARSRGDTLAALAHLHAATLAAPADDWPLLELAGALRDFGHSAEAAVAFHRIIAIAPNNVHAHLGLGQIARARGDRGGSLSHFYDAMAAEPDNVWANLEAAAELREVGQLDEAGEKFKKVISIAPDSIHAHLGLGHIARSRGDRQESLAHFSAAAALAPDNIWANLETAADLKELGRLDEAAAHFQKVNSLAQDNIHAHFGLGQIARARGDKAASLSHFLAAAAIEPDNIWANIEAAADHKDLGQFDLAEAMFRKVLSIEADNLHARLGLGHCARARGDHKNALVYFEAVTRTNPGHSSGWLDLSVAFRETGNITAARQTLNYLLDRDPRNLQAMLCLGETERHAGRHEAALAAFQNALALAPESAGTLTELAKEEGFLGHLSNAQAFLSQALALDPRHVPAILALGEQAMLAADAARALAIYRRASQQQPEQLWFKLGIVEALTALGKTQQALENIAGIQTAHDELPNVYLKQLDLLRQSGHCFESLRLAREMTAQFPYHFWLHVERFHSEILLGSAAEIEACLAGVPAGTVNEKATLERLRGNFAEAFWHIEDAATHYEAAASLNPQDPWCLFDLVRVKILTLDLSSARRDLLRFCDLTAHVSRLRRRPLNISQTHYGELLNDYAVNQDMLSQLTLLKQLGARPRAMVLKHIVRDNPNSTAAAVSLMLALRLSGGFARQAIVAPINRIPQQIIQFWDSELLPEDVAALTQSWRDHNPDYTIRLFNENTAAAFLSAKFPSPVLQAFERASEPVQKADIFRLAWLASEGGIYADADDRCVAPAATLIPDGAELVLYQEDHATLCNNFIAAAPNHPILTRAFALAVTAINRGDSETVWFLTGPALLTRAFAQVLADDPADSINIPAEIIVLDRRELANSVAIHCSTGYKRTGQHWSNPSFARRNHAAEEIALP